MLLDGTWRLDADLAAEGGAVVQTALREAMSEDAPGEPTRTVGQRRADALVDLCRWYLGNRGRPHRGRRRPHLDVLITLGELHDQLPGRTAQTTVVDPASLRRLACDAGVHRVVTDGGSHVLDYGRETRAVPDGLFHALVLRDAHCRFPGCDRPPEWCEAHHLRHWLDGGRTELTNLALCCTRHHQLLHQSGWRAELLPDGLATLVVTTADGRRFTSAAPLSARTASARPSPSRRRSGSLRCPEPSQGIADDPVGQQRLAMAVATELGQHDQVLRVHAMHPQPGGEVPEPPREADHLPIVLLCYRGEGGRQVAEPRDAQRLHGGLRLVRRAARPVRVR